MNEIVKVPESVTNAGLDFSYARWSPGTELTLCNVPWDSAYRNIVDFASGETIDSYIDNAPSVVRTLKNATYARLNEPVRVEIPFNKAMRFNYLRVANPMQPIDDDIPKAYYYFINGARHIAPNTTELDIQLDVWQSFKNNVAFGMAYIERGHIGIANENQMASHGNEYLNVPEGFDLGSDYMSTNEVGVVSLGAGTASSGRENKVPMAGMVIVSTIDLSADAGNVNAPILKMADGSSVNGFIHGANIYYGALIHLNALLRELKEKPWVSQGILSITITPNLPKFKIAPGSEMDVPGGFQPVREYDNVPSKIGKLSSWDRKKEFKNVLTNVFSFDGVMSYVIPERYRTLKKFLISPYRFIELSMYNGQGAILKPEMLDTHSDNLNIVVGYHPTPPNPRVLFYAKNYGGVDVGVWGDEDKGFHQFDINAYETGFTFDGAGMMSALPQTSIVNNSYMAFMASNANSIAFQYQNAEWSNQRVLAGADMSFNQNVAGINANSSQNRNAMNVNNRQTTLANNVAQSRALQGVMNAGLGALTAGSGAGAAVSALGGSANAVIDYGVTIDQNSQGTAINNAGMLNSTGIQNSYQQYLGDTNLAYAQFAAQGDYQNEIARINAKVQDAKLMQPTVSGQVAGEAFNFVMHGGFEIRVKYKHLQPGVIRMIGELWLRYGYAINRFHRMAKLSVMSKFTYWKVKEINIISSTCPEFYKQTIRGVFEKGVTVWRKPGDIGNIDYATNEPVKGIRL